ncbi:hypothetical protein NIG5292_02862 [Nereida ignava]|uniref:Uncharacterized protein n=1 Tax=Nereida ignava TaxID=282199 RepID=A0A0U1NPU0_9RHOB|nr:hypothetical protein NIG5292_02862 [Nereida ignava]SFJ95300.1 hypothetical protein SAMN02745667_02868 [Nereida ignava DSM 16309]
MFRRSLGLAACLSVSLLGCSATTGTVGSIDVTKQPRGVLPSSTTTKLWTAYVSSPQFQCH